ncbi:MAG: 50S ribosomal protein L22 [Candidatus Yanofskybacteria bacterium]|nr:50S ribosomal protein L22 [Candidatus Yanofskybacteria bacterium]
MKVTAQLNNLRLAPRKVRAVVDLVKRRDVTEAMHQLQFMVRRPAPQLLKLVKSAIANAENTYRMIPDNLYIKEFVVDEGIKLKRYMPRARGRATEIQKKTSLVRIILDEKVPGLKKEAEKAKPAHDHDHEHEHLEPEIKAEPKKTDKPEVKREMGKKGVLGGLKKKIFQRKAV